MFENYSFDYRQIDLQRGVSKSGTAANPPASLQIRGGRWLGEAARSYSAARSRKPRFGELIHCH